MCVAGINAAAVFQLVCVCVCLFLVLLSICCCCCLCLFLICSYYICWNKNEKLEFSRKQMTQITKYSNETHSTIFIYNGWVAAFFQRGTINYAAHTHTHITLLLSLLYPFRLIRSVVRSLVVSSFAFFTLSGSLSATCVGIVHRIYIVKSQVQYVNMST